MTSIRHYRFRHIFTGALFALMTALGFLPGAQAQFVITNSSPKPMPRRPNIILIVADGLGYGDLSCYGQTKFQTPNLDRLAAEGIRFTSYYAGDAASSPARAALMLGKDSGQLKQRADVDVPLATDDVTVAQLLKQSGYHTGLIGEWDLGGDGTSGVPWNKGFDEFAGYFDAGEAENYYADYMWRHDSEAHFQGKAPVYENAGGKKGQYIPDRFTTMAMRFIKNNQPDPFNHHQPFFLLLNYTIPRVNTAEMARTGNGMQVPTDAPYSGEPWSQAEKNKAAMIARFDGCIKQLLEQLQQINQTSNTVIFFSSDTGPAKDGSVDPKFFQSAGPFRGVRGDLYEGGLRVPMIVRWPGKIPAGQVSDFACAAWDFLPTALGIALTKPPENIDGISVLPALFGQTQTNRHDFFYWEMKSELDMAQAAHMDNWKAVRLKAGQSPELYNLKTDPGETQNVADKNPGVVAKFEKLLKR
jgi:arylsulfatase A-like enzyme